MNPSLLRAFKAIRIDRRQEWNSDPEVNRSDTSTKPAWSVEWRKYGFLYWSVVVRSRFTIFAEARMRKKTNSGAERSKESKIIQQEWAQKRTSTSSIEESKNDETANERNESKKLKQKNHEASTEIREILWNRNAHDVKKSSSNIINGGSILALIPYMCPMWDI